MLVVAFHGFPQILPGGFVGVDVFFVISGYLICGLIFDGFQNGGLNFKAFYARRVRRLFPSLIAVLVATLVLGWLFLFTSEYSELGKYVAGSAGFIANLLLWHGEGYFDATASLKPLLHIWSLGIEEQFYIVWPLTLFVAWRLRLNLLLVSAIVLLASFAFNIITVGTDTVEAFYSPFTRFWELQVGGVLALWERGSRLPQIGHNTAGRNALSWLGLSMIVAAAVLFSESTPFPRMARFGAGARLRCNYSRRRDSAPKPDCSWSAAYGGNRAH